MKNLGSIIFCLLLALVNSSSQVCGETPGMGKINIGKQQALYPQVPLWLKTSA